MKTIFVQLMLTLLSTVFFQATFAGEAAERFALGEDSTLTLVVPPTPGGSFAQRDGKPAITGEVEVEAPPGSTKPSLDDFASGKSLSIKRFTASIDTSTARSNDKRTYMAKPVDVVAANFSGKFNPISFETTEVTSQGDGTYILTGKMEVPNLITVHPKLKGTVVMRAGKPVFQISGKYELTKKEYETMAPYLSILSTVYWLKTTPRTFEIKGEFPITKAKKEEAEDKAKAAFGGGGAAPRSRSAAIIEETAVHGE